MDTEIRFKYRENDLIICDSATITKSVYKDFIGKQVKLRKIMKHSNIISYGNNDCQNLLLLIKTYLKTRYYEFDELHLKISKLDLIEFEIDMY